MRVPAAILALAAVTAVAPASAHAATVYITSGPDPTKAFFDAAPGEVNQLTVTYDSPSRGEATVHDPGAALQAVAPCEALDEHTVRCPPQPVPEGFPGYARVAFEVRLGDGNDSLTTQTGKDYPFDPVVADGGTGDDVLTGGDGSDRLDGGSGADRIIGGPGGDFMSDGDRTGESPQPDVVDGGPNQPYEEDTVSYEDRTAGVTADLVRGTGGEPGEGDSLTGFESAVGGAGDDRLIDGDAESGHLSGNAGDDTLIGGPGFNVITGGRGDDIIASGPAGNSITGGRGLETYRCSRSVDHIYRPDPGELLGPLCEVIDFSPGEFGSFAFPPLPVRTTRRAAWFRIGCPRPDEESDDFHPCTAVLKLQGGRGNRLLGRAEFERLERTTPPPESVRVKLTRVGRRLAARRNGVVATVRFRSSTPDASTFDPNKTAVAWTIRLRTPR
jgi:RTX calcium-binding nonapeptide repeat (4 copies)